MRTFASLVVLVLVACGEPSTPAATAEQAAAQADTTRFEPGRRLHYRFAWTVDSESRALAILPDGGAVAAGLRLSGELSLRVLPPTARGALVGLAIDRLDDHAITMMGHDALVDPADLVGHEMLVELAPDGTPLSLYFDPQAPTLARTILPGLLAQADLRVPTRADEQRVAAGAGLADVRYAWTDPARLVRTLQGYSRFDAFVAAGAPQVTGRLEVELDGDRLPTRITGAELVAAADAQREDAFRSETSFSLERTASTVEAIASAPMLEGMLAIDPSAPPDRELFDRTLAQRFAAGMTAGDVEHAIFGAGNGLLPPRDYIVRATGRLRGWPELASELEPLFDQFDDPRARALVIDTLASGGTSQAQASMRRLLGDEQLFNSAGYAQWLQRFAFLARPDAESATFLLDIQTGAHERGDERVRQAALYPIGVVARRIAHVEPIAAAALRARLHEELAAADDDIELRVAALAGIGNAADPADVDLVLAHIDEPEEAVRGQVATALRDQLDEVATARLVGLTSDASHFVAESALTALDHRRGAPIHAERLAGIAIGGVFHPSIAGALVSALLRRHDEAPIVVIALASMRARARDPRERGRIDATLATAAR